MKARAVGYWICTVQIALSFLSGGAVYLLRVPQAVEGVTHLGYPLHFVTLLGIWKLLGGVAILLPGFARLKEWAYAGMIFDLTGAAVAQAAAGDGVRHVLVPLALAAMVVATRALRPEDRKLKQGLSSGGLRTQKG
jgi:uncharacterized membrane protein YphA (DoxX/SURF4 family)